MLLVVSPAKSLDYDTPVATEHFSTPDFIDQAAVLVKVLRQLNPNQLGALMTISDKLAQLNTARYQAWSPQCSLANARQAVLAFTGDVYQGLDASGLSDRALLFAQKHLRILSGLYGVLRPLDLMQPYRLEMGTRLANPGGKDLYAFWGDQITEKLNDTLAALAGNTLVNLASNEYFKAVRPGRLKARVVTPVFKDWKNGQYKIISFYAKKARGLMCRYVIDHEVTQVQALKEFDYGGYGFNSAMSSKDQWVFVRRQTD